MEYLTFDNVALAVAAIGVLIAALMLTGGIAQIFGDDRPIGVMVFCFGAVFLFLSGLDLHEYRQERRLAKKQARIEEERWYEQFVQALDVTGEATLATDTDGLGEVRARHQELKDAIERLRSHDRYLALSNEGLRDYIAGFSLSLEGALANPKVRERLLQLSQAEEQRRVLAERVVLLEAEEALWSVQVSAMEESGITPDDLPQLSSELAAWVEESGTPDAPGTIRAVEDFEVDERLEALYLEIGG